MLFLREGAASPSPRLVPNPCTSISIHSFSPTSLRGHELSGQGYIWTLQADVCSGREQPLAGLLEQSTVNVWALMPNPQVPCRCTWAQCVPLSSCAWTHSSVFIIITTCSASSVCSKSSGIPSDSVGGTCTLHSQCFTTRLYKFSLTTKIPFVKLSPESPHVIHAANAAQGPATHSHSHQQIQICCLQMWGNAWPLMHPWPCLQHHKELLVSPYLLPSLPFSRMWNN